MTPLLNCPKCAAWRRAVRLERLRTNRALVQARLAAKANGLAQWQRKAENLETQVRYWRRRAAQAPAPRRNKKLEDEIERLRRIERTVLAANRGLAAEVESLQAKLSRKGA